MYKIYIEVRFVTEIKFRIRFKKRNSVVGKLYSLFERSVTPCKCIYSHQANVSSAEYDSIQGIILLSIPQSLPSPLLRSQKSPKNVEETPIITPPKISEKSIRWLPERQRQHWKDIQKGKLNGMIIRSCHSLYANNVLKYAEGFEVSL